MTSFQLLHPKTGQAGPDEWPELNRVQASLTPYKTSQGIEERRCWEPSLG